MKNSKENNNLNNFGESNSVTQDFQLAIEVCEMMNTDHRKLAKFKPVYQKLKESENKAMSNIDRVEKVFYN